ncbi:murein DD-endopeptidase MepM [Photobacterium angustum]|uniref:murein DD-endopeptidase MepM n=1 Tax=Photobacterium angustum TaxID=661 RepID=UPI0005E53934|nr:murein DD-endopeptidase MepM [Photobacterium angustum]KJG34707.1 peptigoglycan-binding protein LysM [Photobacterium angustum]PSW90752.1 murein DD-endopeptidase MepM [Photobacterium angustum]
MKLYQAVATSIKELPRQHKIALVSTSVLMMAAIMWQPSKSQVTFPSSSVNKRVDVTLPSKLDLLSEQDSEPLGVSLDQNDPEFQAPKDEIEQQLDDAKVEVEHKHRVASGETLGIIFSQYGLPISDMYRLIDANKSVQNLRVGQTLEWEVNDDGKLTELKIIRSKKITDAFKLSKKGYTYKEIVQKGEMKPVTLIGRVNGSFYNSARAAGLTPTQIQTLVKALQWKFNLGREARKGDRFAVGIDREFIDGKAVGKGDVNAFYYKSANGKDSTFIVRGDDDQFYDSSGHSLNRAFRRIPTAKRYRISSPFNPNRLHPVTGRRSPHNGTDFAVPIGTSVLAAGDGVVVKSRYHPLAGNYIVVKHGREYMTRYLHLSKREVKVGDKVKMGQRIAKSGNTGRSTGPHLHFELIKNGRPVNAMKVSLPQADPLYGKERKNFMKQVSFYKNKFNDVISS